MCTKLDRMIEEKYTFLWEDITKSAKNGLLFLFMVDQPPRYLKKGLGQILTSVAALLIYYLLDRVSIRHWTP